MLKIFAKFIATKQGAGSIPAFVLFVWTYQQNQQPSSSVFLSQQTSEQCFQHNKPAKRTGRLLLSCRF
jgi:hypothetical protein